MTEQTPLMKQYQEIKDEHMDAILFFRMGDFYEMFGGDAVVASKILQIALTTRDKNKQDAMPMCGFPHHAIDTYLRRVVEAGHKAAVCEQMEYPALAKGIVKRQVTRVVTPGTFEPDNPKDNTYVLAFYPSALKCGIALADISTGEFILFESTEPLADEINRFSVREVLCPESMRKNLHYSIVLKNYFTTYYDDGYFEYPQGYALLLEHFKVTTLEGFGCEHIPAGISAAGALLSYLLETQKSALSFDRLRPLNNASCMFLDAAAIRNLELIKNLRDLSDEHTLLKTMDETLTPMGGRLLRDTILKPSIDINVIDKRLSAVEALFEDFGLREELRKVIKDIQDVERLTTRLIKGSANARDLIAIKNSLAALPKLTALLLNSAEDYLHEIAAGIADFTSLIRLIEEGIVDAPPNTVKDGWIIKDGVNKEIDTLREFATKGKTYLTELEVKERAASGINSLKISFNRVFGYYIEVTKANLHLVPTRYIRKQTLANAERFITQELKDYENKIVGAEERLKHIEYEYFKEIVDKVIYYAKDLRDSAAAVSMIDMLQSLATVAKMHNYVRPEVNNGSRLEINDGRHPVVERVANTTRFIPNDTLLDLDENKLLIITGPNMAGKSTYMRQAALIVLMAQMGSFVPAESATVGIVDRIFTRIGAADYLSRGQSTFMVEMVETANIVNNATRKSLIILDEVGRGTSTFDGISIAWAVAEFIASEVEARTLFATHYNELTELSLTAPGVKNYNVSVKEWGDEIIFLRKIVKGSADKSYGIQVARLAGLPERIIDRAKDILANLEKKEFEDPQRTNFSLRKKKRPSIQLDLFSKPEDPALFMLKQLDLEKITPQDAVKVLRQLRSLADK
ncbi:DNA mismatch repair protein MutS [Candidatus Magnetobacterium bavaricum]|uniref:DNA mismatch repair protein MutS n=1 Tax=Candidatus Magnetobacterium bavaricum TaxID=29290 RepID=A0A0F3GMV6_9BACT|nr:DNA mismatch repair protein MutS [Candidatus Magnetobacterium bavaricum]